MKDIIDEILGQDGDAAEFLRKLLGDRCTCGATGDLRPWPPDNSDKKAQRFCGACRLKKALAMKDTVA